MNLRTCDSILPAIRIICGGEVGGGGGEWAGDVHASVTLVANFLKQSVP